MRCLAIVIAGDADDAPGWGSFLRGIVQIVWCDSFPGRATFFLYAELEAYDAQRGLPVDLAVIVVGPRGSREAETATGIVQMPVADEVPPIFVIRHQIAVIVDAPGRYELELHIDGELAGSRPIGFFERPA